LHRSPEAITSAIASGGLRIPDCSLIDDQEQTKEISKEIVDNELWR